MQKAEFWIESLQLLPHPEGGYYRETYRSEDSYTFTDATLFNGPRTYATAIHYLLQGKECSKLHKIHSDELWFFHAGHPLKVHIFPEVGIASNFTLGLTLARGQVVQGVVPKESWFGASLVTPEDEHYALVSCVVAPGFDFRDFAFGDRTMLLQKFPRHTKIIERLT